MTLVVCNLKGPLLNLLSKHGLFDAILVTPKRLPLPESALAPSLMDYPFYLETDFRGKLKLSDVIRIHNDFSRSHDYRILPDVLLDSERSFQRYQTYLKEFNGVGTLICPIQSFEIKVIDSVVKLMEKHVDKFLLGLPYRVFLNRAAELYHIIDYVSSLGLGFHLLGFNPTRWPRVVFQKSFSFDSQAVFTYAKRYPSLFLAGVNGWKELDGRSLGLFPLSLETRMQVFFEQLRSWLAYSPSKVRPLDYYLEAKYDKK